MNNCFFKTLNTRFTPAILSGSVALASSLTAQTIDLSQLGTVHPGFQINGVDASDNSGFSVSGAGDVNGDGLADLIVGAPFAYHNGGGAAGESYVVFGKTSSTPVELGALGARGFQINGIAVSNTSGWSVSGAGDVNGDGLADLIVGAAGAGESYVVFGKTDTTDVELNSLATGGFQINGSDRTDSAGQSVSGAGDVNGDGLADLIVGAYRADANGNESGESYVVFGKTTFTSVELSALGAGGFQINGIDSRDYSGQSVSGAGDVNGDGLADLIVGARAADPDGRSGAGESYVVFGKTDSTPVELSALATGGFQIDGIDAIDLSGFSVSGAGDVNGDGLADLIVGAVRAAPNGRTYAGESYVVFGKTDSTLVQLSTLSTGGFQINGIDAEDNSGFSVSGAGDVNGDGLADLIVGAIIASPNGSAGAGESYVVFGKTSSTPVELSALGTGGILINGSDANDRSGFSVSGAGDVNGDGLADLIVGANLADTNGRDGAGESYVIFSPSAANASAIYRATALGGDAPRVAVGISGDGSNDSTPDSRTFIDFSNGSNVSLQTVMLTRNNSFITNLNNTVNVLWEITTDRTDWTNANVTFNYTDAEIAGFTESTLKLFQASSTAGPWSELTDATLSQTRNQISADVSSFGYFAIFGLDDSKPTSAAFQAFAEIGNPSTELVIRYDSEDANSGIATVELFYRFNGGSYVSAGSTKNPEFIRIYTASLNGEGTYDFYTVATDNAGNVEEAPATPDITIETEVINSVWIVR